MSHPSTDQLATLQDRLQYGFVDSGLLTHALTHRSYLNEAAGADLESNERLEFLGDAILGAIVARRLFEMFPDADEGWLTTARSRLVRKETLGRLGRDIGLGACLLVGAGIDNDGTRYRDSVLSCAVEAVVGAIWVDGGASAVERVVQRLLASELASISAMSVVQDPKSQLQELTQSRNGTTPTYDTIGVDGPQHQPLFRAVVVVDDARIAEGEGSSKRAAEMEAARRALHLLQQEPG